MARCSIQTKLTGKDTQTMEGCCSCNISKTLSMFLIFNCMYLQIDLQQNGSGIAQSTKHNPQNILDSVLQNPFTRVEVF
jgi:hypothetical protein